MKLLSPDSLDDNMSLSRQAWTVAAPESSHDDEDSDPCERSQGLT
jgi:hypothetical protein